LANRSNYYPRTLRHLAKLLNLLRRDNAQSWEVQYLIYIFEDEEANFVAMTSYEILIDTAKVNIYLSKDYRNKKYSQEILSESINKFLSENKNIKYLQAYILEENIASKKLFENLGFIYDNKKEICNDGLEYLIYKKDTIQ